MLQSAAAECARAAGGNYGGLLITRHFSISRPNLIL
jgi:hypothetical protein